MAQVPADAKGPEPAGKAVEKNASPKPTELNLGKVVRETMNTVVAPKEYNNQGSVYLHDVPITGAGAPATKSDNASKERISVGSGSLKAQHGKDDELLPADWPRPNFGEAVRETAKHAQKQILNAGKLPDGELDQDISRHIYDAFTVTGEKGIHDLVAEVNHRMANRGELAEARGSLKVEMLNKDGSLRPPDKEHTWAVPKLNPEGGYVVSLFDSHKKLIAQERVNTKEQFEIK